MVGDGSVPQVVTGEDAVQVFGVDITGYHARLILGKALGQ
jgi:hypothetical protein